MALKDEILKKERDVLKSLGNELNEGNWDERYKDTYYKDYTFNLYEPMDAEHIEQYGGGSGGELKPTKSKPAKMASIRSSSAMTFNLLGNSFIRLKAFNILNHTPGSYSIEYEKQYETISNGKKQQPANLDAFLISEDGSEIIFCEMKMMEWISKNEGELKAAYQVEKNYRHTEYYIQFMKAIEVIGHLKLSGGFEYYDVWQMLKHTIAIHNYMSDIGFDKLKKVTLLNVVFEPDSSFLSDRSRSQYEDILTKEHEGFRDFRFALEEAGIIRDNSVFDVKYVSARDFIDCFEISEMKRKYLRRYTLEE